MLMVAVFEAGATIVADSTYRTPLPNASVFDRRGRLAGICDGEGRLPYVSPPEYPIRIRYIGYNELTVPYADYDTIFLCENITQLPDLVVNSKEKRVLHVLAYVREFSTLTTYSDTITLFREKLVDYMVSAVGRQRKSFGWTTPRVLDSQSYYRFTDRFGLDSVSNRSNQHFSWADWVGMAPEAELPEALKAADVATDTLRGKYSATEIWKRNGDRLTLDVDVLSDTSSRRWVPSLAQFFHNHLDFELFRVRFNFGNVVDDRVGPIDLASYSFNIESNGRGLQMFKFNRRDEPFFVSTYGEVYIIDKQYIPIKEAKKWERLNLADFDLGIIVPPEAPALPPDVEALIERVEDVDHDEARLSLALDKRVAAMKNKKFNPGAEIMNRIKGMFGIDQIIGRHKVKRQWSDFRTQRRNRKIPEENSKQ